MERENSKQNSTKIYSISVTDILSERIKEQDLLEKLLEKEGLLGINIKKDRKGKEGKIAVLSFGTEESAQTAIAEINKIEQYTAKKLAQNNRENTSRADSTKEQNMANQAVKQCCACKTEDHEIKDCKKRINILLRYTDSRYTISREMKEKTDQYGTVISIRNKKSEYDKTQKESMVCFATEAEAKRAMTDIKYNYLQEGWHAEIYLRKKQAYIEPSKVRKRNDNNITDDQPRIGRNISNNKMAQSDEGKNSLAQGKKRYACNSSEHQIKESTKKRNILVKYKERGYTYSERELKEMMEEHGKVKNIKSRKSSYGSSFNESMICYNDEQQAETATVEINKFRGWTAELYQSYCQKQNSHKQNNIQQQEAKENNTKSNRQSTSERSEIDRLKEEIQQQKEEIKALK